MASFFIQRIIAVLIPLGFYGAGQLKAGAVLLALALFAIVFIAFDVTWARRNKSIEAGFVGVILEFVIFGLAALALSSPVVAAIGAAVAALVFIVWYIWWNIPLFGWATFKRAARRRKAKHL